MTQDLVIVAVSFGVVLLSWAVGLAIHRDRNRGE